MQHATYNGVTAVLLLKPPRAGIIAVPVFIAGSGFRIRSETATWIQGLLKIPLGRL
jgi:hypothetical protein